MHNSCIGPTWVPVVKWAPKRAQQPKQHMYYLILISFIDSRRFSHYIFIINLNPNCVLRFHADIAELILISFELKNLFQRNLSRIKKLVSYDLYNIWEWDRQLNKKKIEMFQACDLLKYYTYRYFLRR